MPACLAPDVNGRTRVAAVGALLALLVGVAYGNSLQDGFAFDDRVMIEQNVLITRLHNLPTLLMTDYWAGRRAPSEAVPWSSGLYRPLVLVTYALNYAVGGLHPFGYHLLNLFLHLTVTWLLFSVALRLGLALGAATVAAALFAVHPLHTEAVTGIIGRAELMMAAGLLGSLWWAAQGRRGLSLLAFAAGLFSKEQAVVLPVVLVLYDACVGNFISGRTDWGAWFRLTLFRYGGYVLVLAGYLLVRTMVLGRLTPPSILFLDNPMAHLEWDSRLLSAIKVAGQYLWLCIWPASLSADYSYNAIPVARSLLEPGVLPALLAWGSLLGLAAWSFQRDRRACFSVGLMAVTFAPVSNLVVPIGTIMGERLFYLPSAGLCLLAGLGWEQVARRLRVEQPESQRLGAGRWIRFGGLALFLAICLALTVRTALRNQDWATTETLLRSAAHTVPASAKVHAALGTVALAKEEWDQALQHYHTAMGLYPEYPRTEVTLNLNLGAVFLHTGRLAEALNAFERAVALDPRSSVTQYNLGLAYVKQGQYEKAETALRRALALNPESAESYNTLAHVLLEQRRYQEALAQAEAALQRRPDFREAHDTRARALKGLGRLEEAAAEDQRVRAGRIVPGLLSIDPDQ